jgi:hypothetical protein
MNKSLFSPVHVCPHCEKRYTLGVDGTIEGCDPCMNVIRNKLDGTIIQPVGYPFLPMFEEFDSMTDMEKA